MSDECPYEVVVEPAGIILLDGGVKGLVDLVNFDADLLEDSAALIQEGDFVGVAKVFDDPGDVVSVLDDQRLKCGMVIGYEVEPTACSGKLKLTL